jgi:predicted transcriptional regulator
MSDTTLTIRIEASLKQAAEQSAAARDETLSQVVRRALRAYVHEHAKAELIPTRKAAAKKALKPFFESSRDQF